MLSTLFSFEQTISWARFGSAPSHPVVLHVWERDRTDTEALYMLNRSSSFPPPQPLATTILLFVSMSLTIILGTRAQHFGIFNTALLFHRISQLAVLALLWEIRVIYSLLSYNANHGFLWAQGIILPTQLQGVFLGHQLIPIFLQTLWLIYIRFLPKVLRLNESQDFAKVKNLHLWKSFGASSSWTSTTRFSLWGIWWDTCPFPQ